MRPVSLQKLEKKIALIKTIINEAKSKDEE